MERLLWPGGSLLSYNILKSNGKIKAFAGPCVNLNLMTVSSLNAIFSKHNLSILPPTPIFFQMGQVGFSLSFEVNQDSGRAGCQATANSV